MTFWQDLRFGLRVLWKKPGFTTIAVLALALGIGANTAIFSVVNSVLLRPLPYEDPDRLVMLWTQFPEVKLLEFPASPPEYLEYREANRSFAGLAAFRTGATNLTGGDAPERVETVYATADLFSLLGREAARGRVYTPAEDRPGQDGVAVLSDGLWRRRFGADPRVIGQTMQLNGLPRTIIGIMPREFQFPTRETEVWLPLALDPANPGHRGSHNLQMIGRLRPGVTLAQARAENQTLVERWETDRAQFHHFSTKAHPVILNSLSQQVIKEETRTALLVLLGAVGLVLLIACANVANLLLARAEARQREVAIRTALGAARWRLIRQLLTESLLLALCGGGLGLLLAVWATDFFVALGAESVPRLHETRIDASVLIFTLAVSLVTGLLFGLAPALQASKLNLNETLREGGRGSMRGARGALFRQALVVSEVALSVILVAGAGLLLMSFFKLQRTDPGFETENVLTLQLALPSYSYREDQQVTNFYRDLLGRVATLPGVRAAGAVSTTPLYGKLPTNDFEIEGRRPEPGARPQDADLQVVSSGYFTTMEIPLVKGRYFTEQDTGAGTGAAVVNESMARVFWPHEEPLGKLIRMTPQSPWLSIVGVVKDVKQNALDEESRPELYLSYLQAPASSYLQRDMAIVVRTAAEPGGVGAAVRKAVAELDASLPVYRLTTMEQIVAQSIAQPRFMMLLLGIFAVVALALAAVGIFGVLSFYVTQRTHEIGIRLAMGAQKRDILRLVVGQGMALALTGLVLGLVGSLAAARLLAGLLYQVSAADPFVHAGVALLLSFVAFVACYLPARRAMRVDPMVALRYE